ncbi:hypothetical protein GCM10023238_05060 [Streptomyces heliomycini]
MGLKEPEKAAKARDEWEKAYKVAMEAGPLWSCTRLFSGASLRATWTLPRGWSQPG